jgi:2-polyprenyl-6-methoxyphenol hydroxylase-like FAD-dependent oxidoreductase
MRSPLKVLIIGAGTGGLCLAHGLKRAGIEVRIFERDRTRRDGLQGYRVGISPAGSYALHECLPPDLYRLFVDTCARPPRYFNMLTERMEELVSVDLPDTGDAVDSEKSVSRMTLRQILLTGLEADTMFDKKFSHYGYEESGAVTAFFEDGSSATGDLLVGADGANSRVRRQRLPKAEMQHTGIVSIGGKVPLTEETRTLLSKKVLHGISLVMAPRGMGAILHVMEFPWRHAGIEHDAGGNDTALLAEWPGLLYDNTRDHIIWGIWAAGKNYPTNPQGKTREDQLRIAAGMTKGWHPEFRRLLEHTDPTTVFSIDVRTSVPPEPWETDCVTLLGDAVHTMTPGRGVGANTALRDALTLCRRLVDVRDGRLELIPALHAYEEEMLGYSSEAVIESRKQMDSNDLIHAPGVGRVLLALMRMWMRLVNRVPLLKRQMLHGETKLRKIEDDGREPRPQFPERGDCDTSSSLSPSRRRTTT